DHRVFRRVEVKPNDVHDLLDEEWVGRKLEGLLAMRLNPEGCPGTLDRRLGEPRLLLHGTHAPVRAAVRRLRMERLVEELHDLLILDAAGPSRPTFIVEPHQALLPETLAPLPDRVSGDPDFLGHLLVIEPLRAPEHD